MLQMFKMAFLYKYLGILLALTSSTLQVSLPSSLYYIAAVVQYRPLAEVENGKSLGAENAQNLLTFIKKANEYDADIIVFPESGLTSISEKSPSEASYIPNKEENVVLCGDESNKYAEALKMISCAARDHNMYVVVNHPEKKDCTDSKCKPGEISLFNTNIVFDRQGKVVAKYRTYINHDHHSSSISPPNDSSTFITDFNVTIGQFSCVDVLYETENIKHLRDMNISNVIYATQTDSESPFLCNDQMSRRWAYLQNANLLRSGYNEPQFGIAGAGIYPGIKAALAEHQDRHESNTLLLAEIPFVVTSRRHKIDKNKIKIHKFTKDEISTTMDTNKSEKKAGQFTDYVTEVIVPKSKETRIQNKNYIMYSYDNYTTLCDGDVCCKFDFGGVHDGIWSRSREVYQYRFAVFNGGKKHTGQKYVSGIDVCALISCTDDSIESCGKHIESNLMPYAEPFDFYRLIIDYNSKPGEEKSCVWPLILTKDQEPKQAYITGPPFGYLKNDSSGESLEIIQNPVLINVFPKNLKSGDCKQASSWNLGWTRKLTNARIDNALMYAVYSRKHF